MATYSFKEMFCPYVKDGSKRQTVRAYRKDGRLPKVGEDANLFYAMRTKYCTRLNEKNTDFVKDAKTVFVDKKGIMVTTLRSKVDAELLLNTGKYKKLFPLLSKEEASRFAWLDGMRPEGSTLQNPGNAYEIFHQFFKQLHSLPFVGTVTYW